MFEVGQKVWDVILGEGVVSGIDDRLSYPVIVEFVSGEDNCYTESGMDYDCQETPSLYPYPVEIVKKVVKPTINWEHVGSKFNYLAEDLNGKVFLYEERPFAANEVWSFRGDSGEAAEAHMFASYTQGTCNWKDSLVKRPG